MPKLKNLTEVEARTRNHKQYLFLDSNQNKRYLVMYGGGSSGKSKGISWYLSLFKFCNQIHNGILCVRKTVPEVKNSCFKAVRGWLDEYGIDYNVNLTERIITHPLSKSYFQFVGLDDIEKIKSIEGINIAWIEEATEIKEEEFLRLDIDCRAKNHNPGAINQLYLSFNPIDPVKNAYLKRMTDTGDTEDTAVCHCTWRDNDYLTDREIKVLTRLPLIDATYDKIYNKGEWATPENIIYSNWDIVESIDWERCKNIGYGLDFGYNNPTALVKIGIYDKIHAYIEEKIYKTELTNTDLIELMKQVIPENERHFPIYADSAEPKTIEEIRRAGFNIHPCIKGPDSVKIGIDRVKRYKLHIFLDSESILTEIKSYKWMENKEKQVLDKPLEYNDHAMDAIRYYIGQTPQAPTGLWVVGQVEY